MSVTCVPIYGLMFRILTGFHTLYFGASCIHRNSIVWRRVILPRFPYWLEKGMRRILRYLYLMDTLISCEYGLTISSHVTVLRQWPLEKNTDYLIINIMLLSCLLHGLVVYVQFWSHWDPSMDLYTLQDALTYCPLLAYWHVVEMYFKSIKYLFFCMCMLHAIVIKPNTVSYSQECIYSFYELESRHTSSLQILYFIFPPHINSSIKQCHAGDKISRF